MKIEAVNKRRISGEIADNLRKSILRGEIGAGEKLPAERELADKLGTNRNTLREAVRTLEAFRLVRVRQGEGVSATDFREEGGIALAPHFLTDSPPGPERARFLADLLFFRKILLVACAELSATNRSEQDAVRLESIAAAVEAEFSKKRPGGKEDRGKDTAEPAETENLMNLDMMFLDTLIRGSGSLLARWFFNEFSPSIRAMLEELRQLWRFPPAYRDMIEKVTGAVRAGKPREAAGALGSYFEELDRTILGGPSG